MHKTGTSVKEQEDVLCSDLSALKKSGNNLIGKIQPNNFIKKIKYMINLIAAWILDSS